MSDYMWVCIDVVLFHVFKHNHIPLGKIIMYIQDEAGGFLTRWYYFMCKVYCLYLHCVWAKWQGGGETTKERAFPTILRCFTNNCCIICGWCDIIVSHIESAWHLGYWFIYLPELNDHTATMSRELQLMLQCIDFNFINTPNNTKVTVGVLITLTSE